MKVTWFGHAAFGLQPENGPNIISDPYTPKGMGYAPIIETADLVIISSDDDSAHRRADLIDGDPEVVNALTVAQNGGRAQASGIEITAIETAEWDHHPEHEIPGQNGMYRFTLDGINCAHMGDVGNPLTDAQQSFFDGTDVLFALAGGYLTLELPDLMEMVHRTRPRLVIPMHFRTLTYRPRNTMWIECFLSHFKEEDVDFAFGSTHEIRKEDLPDRTIQNPGDFNWMTPGTKRMHGAHQRMWESLFILNYGTGALDAWPATGFESNADSTEFTITLRDCVEWSDGEAFNADDVVFTTNIAMINEEISSREASTIRE